MIVYQKASADDIYLLIENRMKLLKNANMLGDESELKSVKEQLCQYYTKAISSKNHIAYLAYEKSICIGTGGICFYQVLPTYHNPTGKKAYITNIYTMPEYRNKGIATHILDYLVRESLKMGVDFISLETTESGRSIYEKYGFAALRTEMQLKNETFDMNQNM